MKHSRSPEIMAAAQQILSLLEAQPMTPRFGAFSEEIPVPCEENHLLFSLSCILHNSGIPDMITMMLRLKNTSLIGIRTFNLLQTNPGIYTSRSSLEVQAEFKRQGIGTGLIEAGDALKLAAARNLASQFPFTKLITRIHDGTKGNDAGWTTRYFSGDPRYTQIDPGEFELQEVILPF